jgi:hypothetical protein
MPPLLAVPGDANHVLAEDAAEPGIGDHARPLLGPESARGLPDRELKSRGFCAHNTKRSEPHERPGGHRPAPREEGRGLLGDKVDRLDG